uniref:BED-type domain-containing protein n=1 Tax=Parastrongyloides trichosuri TaxID=131310 RepID=A0A0N4ZJ46_PARTI
MVSCANNDSNMILNQNFDTESISNTIFSLLNKSNLTVKDSTSISDSNDDKTPNDDNKKLKTLGDLFNHLNDDMSVDDTFSTNSNDCNYQRNTSNASPTGNKAAGRKKSHAVWNFFKDLKEVDPDGNGAICLYCNWKAPDKGPNNLKIHLKKNHMEDGIYAQFAEAVAKTPTQPYSKRKRNHTENNDDQHKTKQSKSSSKVSLSTSETIDLTSIFGSIMQKEGSNELEQENNESPFSMPYFSSFSKALNFNVTDGVTNDVENSKITDGEMSLESQNIYPMIINAALSQQQPLFDNVIQSNDEKPTLFQPSVEGDTKYFSMFVPIARELNLTMNYRSL